jgi:hypothetical protein
VLNRASSHSKWQVGHDDSQIPVGGEQLAPRCREELCRRHRWHDESIHREFAPPIHAVVARAKILEEVFGDPCRDVACEPRRDDDADVDPWLCCRLVERR